MNKNIQYFSKFFNILIGYVRIKILRSHYLIRKISVMNFTAVIICYSNYLVSTIFIFSYTSSRTSLEPSECGEDIGSVGSGTVITIPGPAKPTTNVSVANSTCHVSLINNRFEENRDSTCTKGNTSLQQGQPPPPPSSLLPPVQPVQQRTQVVSDHDSVGTCDFISSVSFPQLFFPSLPA